MLGERISHIPVSIKVQSYVCQAAFCHSKKHPQQLNGLKQQTFLSCLCSIAWLQFWWNDKGRINIWGMITWSIKITLRGWCGPSRLAESVYLTISLAYRAPKDHLTRMLLPELSHWLVHPENKCRAFLLWFIPKEGPRIHGLFTAGAQGLSESYSMLQVLRLGPLNGAMLGALGASWLQQVLYPLILESHDGTGGLLTSQTPTSTQRPLANGSGISSLSYPL